MKLKPSDQSAFRESAGLMVAFNSAGDIALAATSILLLADYSSENIYRT